MKVNDDRDSSSDAVHFGDELPGRVVVQVMQQQRAHHDVKAIVVKRQPQAVALQGCNAELGRPSCHRVSGVKTHLGADEKRLLWSQVFFCGFEKLARAGTNVEDGNAIGGCDPGLVGER